MAPRNRGGYNLVWVGPEEELPLCPEAFPAVSSLFSCTTSPHRALVTGHRLARPVGNRRRRWGSNPRGTVAIWGDHGPTGLGIRHFKPLSHASEYSRLRGTPGAEPHCP